MRLTRTGSPLTSACSCISAVDRVMPPSQASSESGPATSAKAVSASSTWSAIDSRAARASWGRRVPREKPLSTGLAERSHQGAPRPPKAGTSATPSLLAPAASAKRVSVSTSRRSASQVKVRPVDRMLASRACTGRSTCQATVAQTPEAAEARGPRAITDEPVP